MKYSKINYIMSKSCLKKTVTFEKVLENNGIKTINEDEDDEEENVFDIEEVAYYDYLNVLTALYNKNTNNINHLFVDINYDEINSTNTRLEFIYYHLHEYNNCVDDDDKDLIKCNENNINENKFILCINKKKIFECKYLLSLVMYLCSIDWVNYNWEILFPK